MNTRTKLIMIATGYAASTLGFAVGMGIMTLDEPNTALKIAKRKALCAAPAWPVFAPAAAYALVSGRSPYYQPTTTDRHMACRR